MKVNAARSKIATIVSIILLTSLFVSIPVPANAAACAADEDKFLAFHKAFYANQPAENAGAVNANFLKSIGAAIGINSPKFAACVDNGGYSDWVKNVAEAGAKANVNSTPTVFVNGKELDRNTEYFNVEAFAKAIAG